MPTITAMSSRSRDSFSVPTPYEKTNAVKI